MANLLNGLPETLPDEIFEDLLRGDGIRIERILSQGHSSPETGWYDQEELEWVLVVQGSGALLFEDGEEMLLQPGDYLNIPARRKHKVLWTTPDEITIWLAVFYQ